MMSDQKCNHFFRGLGLGETVLTFSTELKSAAASLPPQPSRIPWGFNQHLPFESRLLKEDLPLKVPG